MDPFKTNLREQPHTRPLIFVVDDEPMLLDLSKALLEPAGYTVKTFRDPETALRAFASAHPAPALVITDFAMQGMNGLTLLRRCREIHPSQKVILVSGTVDESVYRDSADKPDVFVAKPYSVAAFLQVIDSVLAA